MLTVYSMRTGDKYPTSYVYKLQSMVARNLSKEHRFVCISDKRIDNVHTVSPPTDYEGWWGKVGLFKEGFATGPSIWLDLDVVIVGSLDPIAAYTQYPLAMPFNWAQSGHGGCQSSVMAWSGNSSHEIYNLFDMAEMKRRKVWGDQEWITELRDSKRLPVKQIDPALIVSYKYHCRPTVPDNARVVVFHGKPDPHECGEQWIKSAWQ